MFEVNDCSNTKLSCICAVVQSKRSKGMGRRAQLFVLSATGQRLIEGKCAPVSNFFDARGRYFQYYIINCVCVYKIRAVHTVNCAK